MGEVKDIRSLTTGGPDDLVNRGRNQTLSSLDIFSIMKSITDSGIGKKIQTDIYIHTSVIEETLRLLTIGRFFDLNHYDIDDIILKINRKNENKITFLHYPSFIDLPHPRLCCSVTIEPDTPPKYRRWKGPNYPILHRKELFISPKHPKYKIFANLTTREVELGLLDEPRKIGWSENWEKRLRDAGIIITGHEIPGNENSKT